MKFMASIFCLCIALIILFLVIFTPTPCEHNDVVKMYSFASQDSTAYSDVRDYCRDCETRFQYHLIKGVLVDRSYLSAIQEHSDTGEILSGEYYTVTATVPLGFYGYGSDKLWLNCKVENEAFIVFFNVEFREDFRELVELIEEGQTITFRGKFYEGNGKFHDGVCGFTDCELIS